MASVVEAIIPAVASPIYSAIYEATFDTEVPGAAFMTTVLCMVVCITAFRYKQNFLSYFCNYSYVPQ